MQATNRMIANTAVQYVKAILTICLSLYSTRLILDALSVNDYGIYSVVAGVVAMLGFVTNALIITTQRFLSVYKMHENTILIRKLFSNSLLIHLVFGLLICIILFSLKGWLFEHLLNIDIARRHTAEMVYFVTIIMLFFTILTSPFKALFIAHENILYVALIEIVDSILKVVFAIALANVFMDRLLVYSGMMLFLVLFNLFAFSIYGLVRYEECCIIIRRRDIDISHIRNLSGFVGWTTYGMGCVAARNQGTAIVLNHFLGTVVNAAYGIAFQINSAIVFLVASLQNAMNPQLMQAEGAGNRDKMLSMASQQSKFAVVILATFIIPLIAEMPAILDLWLKEVPTGTAMFSRFILMAFIFDQITLGLNSANQAMGNIRNFTLVTYSPKLFYLIIIWYMLEYGCTTTTVMILYTAVELLVAIMRIPYMKYKAGLNVWKYVRVVIFPALIHGFIVAAACWLCVNNILVPFRFIITIIIGILAGTGAGWTFVLNREEKEYVKTMIKRHTCISN